MLRRSVLTSAVVLILIASVVVAAERKGPGAKGPGGPGFGAPPGFGPPGGMMGSGLGLLGMQEVQKELGLSDEQVNEVKPLMAEIQKQRRAPFGGLSFEEMQKLSQEDRDKLFADTRKKAEAAAKETDAKLGKILKKEQSERLGQLRLQREGLGAFNRPEVAEELGLTEAQLAKMRKIREDARPQGGFSPDMSEEERREFFANMQKQREKADADVLGVLTAAQKEKWTEMKGKEFKFPQPKFGPGGPGGPGGRGGPGGPGGPGGFGGGKGGERTRPPVKPREE